MTIDNKIPTSSNIFQRKAGIWPASTWHWERFPCWHLIYLWCKYKLNINCRMENHLEVKGSSFPCLITKGLLHILDIPKIDILTHKCLLVESQSSGTLRTLLIKALENVRVVGVLEERTRRTEFQGSQGFLGSVSCKRNYANKLLAALQYSVDIMFINLNNEDGYDFLDRNGWLIGCSGRGCLENRLPGCPLFFAMKFSWAKMGFQATTATWVERIFGITCSPAQCRQISGMSPEVNSSMGGFFC